MKKRKIFRNVKYTHDEIVLIKNFREFCSSHHEISQYPDDLILRFLYSTDLKLQESLLKLQIYHEWFNDSRIQRLNEKALKIINEGTVYAYGRSKCFYPVIYLNLSMIDLKKYDIYDYYSAMNAIINVVI